MEHICHIPTDMEVGRSVGDKERRVIFLCTCALCKIDYEVRDGKWLETHTNKGTRIDLMVCCECFNKETEGISTQG